MVIKLIIFDIDNTLAPPNMPVPQTVVKALKQFEAKGVKISLISGKPVSYLCGLARQLSLREPILSGENGAVIYYSKDFPPKKSSSIAIGKKEAKILENLKSDIVKRFGNTVWMQPNLFNLTIFPKNEKTKHNLFQYVPEYLANLSIKNFKVYKHSDSIEIIPSEIDKGIALKRIRTLENLKKNAVLVVGDGENDIPMFNEAGISIGIGMTGTTHSFPNIQKAIKFIHELIGRTNE